jgi:hypothetical protein
MFSGGLRPYQLSPINRGCVNTVVFVAVEKADCDAPETQIDKTSKRLFLTAKTHPWDTVANDSDAVFKVEGVIPDPANEPGRVVFTLSEQDTYKDPTVPYFCDIVETDSDGTSNANRLFIGSFNIIAGPNNAQAGGSTE